MHPKLRTINDVLPVVMSYWRAFSDPEVIMSADNNLVLRRAKLYFLTEEK